MRRHIEIDIQNTQQKQLDNAHIEVNISLENVSILLIYNYVTKKQKLK
jgi:hypothetical protein